MGGNEEAIRAVRLSLLGLAATSALQLGVVLVSGSVALLADSAHNAADALTAVPLWVAFRAGRRPPTRRYTYGYGRGEDLAGIFIVAVIGLSASVSAWQGIERLLDPRPVSHVGW
ncbi:MAG TPA: cation diffusion facilitator family transporter, partial [Chloroflexota bacterium]|nr:cation diffusion facilitator family transporter [Chloroflexota bacterium]